MTDSNVDNQAKTWTCGTLAYTRGRLAMLFFWLLWGDFCYMLMETVTPSIMPLKFESLHASNAVIGLVMTSIPTAIYSAFNPIISYRSDRFRSRWGRRIPFILASLPFLVMSLIGLAFGDRLGFWFHTHIQLLRRYNPNAVAIATLAVLLAVFTFFNTFVTSVFWYLFNDVVPEHLLARFMSWFRMISTLTAALYSFFIFRYAGTHAEWIFIGAAALYFLGFGAMCLNVKEGGYPPPAPYLGKDHGFVPAVQTFLRETHGNRLYWYEWLLQVFFNIGAGASAGGFMIFFYQSTGMSLARIGDINGCVSIATSVLILGSGWLADVYHPLRVVIAGVLLSTFVLSPAMMIWLVWLPQPHVAFWIWIAISIGLAGPAGALIGVWDPPLLMRLFPRSNYGQFCSVNAVWRSVGFMLGGFSAGLFLDTMGRLVGKERAYFYIPIWGFIFAMPSLLFLLKLYQAWQAHGGDQAYVPPLPKGDLPVAVESVP